MVGNVLVKFGCGMESDCGLFLSSVGNGFFCEKRSLSQSFPVLSVRLAAACKFAAASAGVESFRRG